MKQVRVLRIVVASPGDVKPERGALDRVVSELNQGIAADRGLQLKLVRWETDAHPGFNKEGPQGLIDPILSIEDCDVLIGIFWKRFGTPAKGSQSGTEHEFKVAYKAWKKNSRPQILVYFNQRSSTPQTSEEADQWMRVLKFRETFPKEGLWWPYRGKAEFERLVRLHLTNFIRNQFLLTELSHSSPVDHKVDPETTLGRSMTELDGLYLNHLIEQVGKVYIFGERRDLRRIFVELNVIEEYERPLMHAEYIDIMAAQLQQLRSIFEASEKADETEALKDNKDKRKRVIKPDELLRGRTRAIITGAPGCGKTTLVKYLAMRANEAKRRFPVFLELKIVTEDAFRKAGYNLADLLFELAIADRMHLEETERQQFRQLFFARLAAHEAVICLDGLDEVSDPGLLSQICNSVSSFINDPYGDNTMIITTRTYALQRIDGMKQMEIAPLNQLQIEEFLDHYYGEDPTTKSLLRVFRQRTQLRELMRVPFLLAVIFQLHRTKNIIIEKRLELYRQITYQLGKNLDREKAAVRRPFLIKDPEGALKLDFLSYMACERLFIEDLETEGADQESARLVFTGAAILDKAKQFVEKSKLTHISPYDLAADVKATALLREVGTDTYAFAHLTIQEYLAALALKKQDEFAKLFCRAYFNPTLAEGEALPMFLGMINNPTHFYKMLEGMPESVTFVNLRLRVRGLGYVSNLDSQSLANLTDRLVEFITQKQIEDEPFEEAVRRSFSAATGKPLETIAEQVVSLLLDRKLDLNLKTVTVLEQLGGERALTALIEVLVGAESHDVTGVNQLLKTEETESAVTLELRCRVAEALGRVGGERSVKALIKALMEGSYYVKCSAAEALGQIGGEQAVAALINTLKSSKSYEGQLFRTTADALRQIGSQGAVSALSEVLDGLSTYEYYVKPRVVAALGRIGGEKALKILLKALDSADNDLRINAVAALGQTGGEKAEEALLVALKHSDSYVRMRAARELGRLRSKRALLPLIEGIREDDFYIRASMASALGQVGGERALEALIETLNDESSYVRGVAAAALGELADERAVTALVKALKDPDGNVRLKVIESLRQIEGEQAIAKLHEALNDSEVRIRKKAIIAISELLGDRALELLLQAQDSEAFCVRSVAASALGQVGGERALEALIETLNDESSYVRGVAAAALGELADERAVTALVRASRDPDIYVRGSAVVSLGQIRGEQAREALLSALKDEYLYVRGRAATALSQVGGEKAVKGLIEALSDKDFDMRIIAADSLSQIGGELACAVLFREGDDRSEDVKWRFYCKLAWTKVESDVIKLAPALEDEYVGPSAADALGRVGGEQAVAALIRGLRSTHYQVRKSAAASLAKISREEMGRGLLRALFHKDEFVRKKAAQAVVYYKTDQGTFEQLSILAMVDTHYEVQQAAKDAMAMFIQKLECMNQDVPSFNLAYTS